MAVAAKPDFGDPVDRSTRQPGDFSRHPKTGAPYVAHPTETTKEGGKKADLIVRCAERGIAVPEKVTVAQLHELLGPRPKKVQYGRPSGFGKYIELATAIQRNAERREALGVYLQPSVLDPLNHLEQISIEDLDARDSELRKALDDVAAQALTAGGADLPAERGTWFHCVTEHVDRGESWAHLVEAGEQLGVPYAVQVACVEAYRQALAPVEVLAIEATCVDDVWQLAGTLDRIARLIDDVRFVTISGEIVTLPAGTVMIWDIKTGSLFLDDSGFIEYWRSYAVQLASYQHSRPYDTATDTRGLWDFGPCSNCGGDPIDPVGNACPRCGGSGRSDAIDSKWAVIVHVDLRGAIVDGEAKCRLVLVDLEAGRYAGDLCVLARDWEKRRDVFSIPTDDLCVSVPVEPISAAEAQAAAPAGPAAEPVALDEPQPAVSPAAVVEDQADTGPPPVSAAADQPPTEEPAAEPSVGGPVDYHKLRREQLLADYNRLNAEQRAAFKAFDPPVDDLDAIAAVIWRVRHPRTEDEIARRAADDAERRRRKVIDTAPTPDDREGEFVDDDTREHLRATIKALPADRLALINAVAAEARDAGAPFNTLATVRCYETARALYHFIAYTWDEEIVRDLIAHVLGDPAALQPGITIGAALAQLNHEQAAELADLAVRLDRGSTVLTNSDGRWQPVHAAA